VTVTRVQKASEGVSGYFSLSWKGSNPLGRKCSHHILENSLVTIMSYNNVNSATYHFN